MRLAPIANLIADSGSQNGHIAIFELDMKLTFQAQKDVALLAPVIGEITWRVIHDSDTNISELPGSPMGDSTLALMRGRFYRRPINRLEGNIWDTHVCSPFYQSTRSIWHTPDESKGSAAEPTMGISLTKLPRSTNP